MKLIHTFQYLSNYFEVGEMGIEHALLPEKGLVVAGDVVIDVCFLEDVEMLQ